MLKKEVPEVKQARPSKEVKKIETRIRTCEERIALLEEDLKEKENKLADPGFYADKELAAKLLAEYEAGKTELGSQMKLWEELLQELEQNT